MSFHRYLSAASASQYLEMHWHPAMHCFLVAPWNDQLIEDQQQQQQ